MTVELTVPQVDYEWRALCLSLLAALLTAPLRAAIPCSMLAQIPMSGSPHISRSDEVKNSFKNLLVSAIFKINSVKRFHHILKVIIQGLGNLCRTSRSLSADALTTQAVSTCHTELARSRPFWLTFSACCWVMSRGSALPYLEIAASMMPRFSRSLLIIPSSRSQIVLSSVCAINFCSLSNKTFWKALDRQLRRYICHISHCCYLQTTDFIGCGAWFKPKLHFHSLPQNLKRLLNRVLKLLASNKSVSLWLGVLNHAPFSTT